MDLRFSLTSFLLLVIGLFILVTGEFTGNYGANVNFEEHKYYFSFAIFILFIMSLYNDIRIKKIKIDFSKCPKCKETYDYSKLKKGICPKCNIKTIDMEKYYDSNSKV
ncbi:MAG: hypothetical protein MJK08_02065 [Campylobacterales bacterium]|nr:hypothetical protein [Campylobacterales bacterium]